MRPLREGMSWTGPRLSEEEQELTHQRAGAQAADRPGTFVDSCQMLPQGGSGLSDGGDRFLTDHPGGGSVPPYPPGFIVCDR